MKKFPQVVFLAFALLFTACGKRIDIPKPGEPKTEKQIEKVKENYQNKRQKLEEEITKARNKIIQKRARGYNTEKSEAVLEEARVLSEKIFSDIIAERFEKIEQDLKTVQGKIKEAIELLKTAPEFGEKARKEKGIFVKIEYSGDQALVYQTMGEPDRKIATPVMNLHLRILNPSTAITESDCYNPLTGEFVLRYSPQVEIWVYEKGNEQWAVIFVTSFMGMESLTMQENLNEQERDRILLKLCQFPEDMGTFRKISTIRGRGYPSSTAEVMEYLFVRDGMRIPLAFEAMTEGVKTSALANLNFVSAVFSIKWFPLVIKQEESHEKTFNLVRKLHPGIGGFFNALDEEKTKITKDEVNKNIQKFKDENLEEPSERDLKKIQHEAEKKHAEELDKFKSELYKKMPKKVRKAIDRFWDISNWRATLNVSLDQAKNLISAVEDEKKFSPEDLENLKAELKIFTEIISELRQEYELIDLHLRPNIDKYSSLEMNFSEDDMLALFFLAEGVRYIPKNIAGSLYVDESDLLLKIRIRYKVGEEVIEQLGLDPKKFVGETELKIEPLNRTFKKFKEAQRLTPFGMFFPFKLKPGRYEIEFELIDKNRENMVATYSTSWQITPAN